MFQTREKIDPTNLELRDTVVSINRVTKVVKGGKNMSFRAMVVVGDGKGKVGWGYGKANEVPPSVEKAVKKLHEDFSNIFSKSGLYFDIDASSDESGSDDQPMDAQESAETSSLVETAQPAEELSAPEREGAEGE